MCTTPEFQRKVILVAVDEAHLVQQWGSEVRPAYAQLSALRSRLPSNIPWFACSATLDAATLKEVKRSVSFNGNMQLIRTSVDRPEIDSKLDIQRALLQLRLWLRNKSKSYSAQAVRTIISSYFSSTAEFDQKKVYNEFSKPDSEIRIILSTESLGLGVDISDIYGVVQYSFPLFITSVSFSKDGAA